jgi:hypothetical protein
MRFSLVIRMHPWHHLSASQNSLALLSMLSSNISALLTSGTVISVSNSHDRFSVETLLTHLIPHTFHFARQEHPERSQATAGWAASPFFVISTVFWPRWRKPQSTSPETLSARLLVLGTSSISIDI